MSRARLPPNRGWAKPDGKCRQCGQPVSGRRRTFCSDACVHDWKLKTDPAYQAKHVFARDRGMCELCGLDCVGLQSELTLLRWVRHEEAPPQPEFQSWSWEDRERFIYRAFHQRCDAAGLSWKRRQRFERRLWEMDHRIPVAEGGGACGLENLRTLCWKCHGRVSGELRKRLNAARRASQK